MSQANSNSKAKQYVEANPIITFKPLIDINFKEHKSVSTNTNDIPITQSKVKTYYIY